MFAFVGGKNIKALIEPDNVELSGGTAKALPKPTHVQSISCLDEGSVPSTPTHCYGSISLIRFSQRLAALSHARTSGLIRGFRSTLLRPRPGTGTRSRDPARRGPSATHKAPTPSSAWVPPTRGPEDWPPSRDRGIRRFSWLSVPCTCGRIQALPLEAAVCHATNPDSLTKTSSAPSVCDGSVSLTRLSERQATFLGTKDIRPNSWLSVCALEVAFGHWFSKPRRRTRRTYRCPQNTDPLAYLGATYSRHLRLAAFSRPKISGFLRGFRFFALAAASRHYHAKPRSAMQRSSLTYQDPPTLR